jgi:hypothetical protein
VFPLLTIRGTFAVRDRELIFPDFAGSAWRGVFGLALRRQFCRRAGRSCHLDCSNPGECLYSQVFAPPPYRDSSGNLVDRPRPYAIQVSTPHQAVYPRGSMYQLSLTLLGTACDSAPALVHALASAALLGVGQRRTPLELVSTTVVELPESYTGSSRANIRLVSPTRIIAGGEVVHQPSFLHILAAAYQRVNALIPDAGLPAWPSISSAAREIRSATVTSWWDWRRYSGRDRCLQPFGGVVGEVSVEGDLTPHLPLLALAQRLNVGKHATFGMGHLEVTA